MSDLDKLDESERLKKRAAELIKVKFEIKSKLKFPFLLFYLRMGIIMLLVKSTRRLLNILNHQIMIVIKIKRDLMN
jgi:hypothetical protein